MSSVTVMVIVCVAPCGGVGVECDSPARVRQVSPLRSICTQRRRPPHLDFDLDTAADNVTVNSASDPSPTFPLGPLMLISALSLSSPSSGPVVVLSSSVRVMLALVTERPTVRCRGPRYRRWSHSPPPLESSVGVMVNVPVPVDVSAVNPDARQRRQSPHCSHVPLVARAGEGHLWSPPYPLGRVVSPPFSVAVTVISDLAPSSSPKLQTALRSDSDPRQAQHRRH